MNVGINGAYGLCLMFPYDRDRKARVAGAVDETKITTKDMSEVTFECVASGIVEKMNLKVNKVDWFSTYKVHHRVTETFRKGRAFLTRRCCPHTQPRGWAGHEHGNWRCDQPGMEACSGAQRTRQRFTSGELPGGASSFCKSIWSPRRMAFSTSLLRMDSFAKFLRNWVVPALLPVVSRIDSARRAVFRRVSQLMLNYRHSTLSDGPAGSVQGGDRVDNFESLKGTTWQIHVYGAVKEGLWAWCQSHAIPLHVFPWTEKYQEVGFGTGCGVSHSARHLCSGRGATRPSGAV
ncbi:hypothetical protein VTO42DRAFT_5517 [Malbranchea cinnamomea]